MTCILGDTTAYTTSGGNNYDDEFAFAALHIPTCSFVVTAINANCLTDGSVEAKFGLYDVIWSTGAGGHWKPNNLLAQTAAFTNTSWGWKAVPLGTPVPVIAGVRYYLAILAEDLSPDNFHVREDSPNDLYGIGTAETTWAGGFNDPWQGTSGGGPAAPRMSFYASGIRSAPFAAGHGTG